jgi:DNA helicase II / ATP-dependent DNA helicase PcrA
MMEQKDLLAGLNEPQKKAVTMTEGPLLILAGPGSGKTRVITHRIAYLVQHEHISPWRILAVTFTNKAAKEMRERLERLVGLNESKEMTIGTFHAICARVLRIEADYLAPLGLNKSFVILDTDDQTTLIKQAVRDLNLDEKQYKPATMQGLISRAKNDLLVPDQMAEQAAKYIEEVAARVYKVYQKLLRANNSVDFDDLLLLTEQLWRREGDVLHRYQLRWQYIHVDEFQDCNLPQYKLIRLLGYGTSDRHEGLGNVCVVGDDDQMIYSWRGASSANVQQFEADFPRTKIVMLEQNYRSTQSILDAAQNVVRRNRSRKDKKLWTALGTGEKIMVYEAYNEEEEGLFTAREITRLLARGEIDKRGDVAVMYRTNAQSRAIEEQFLRANIPYKVIGSRKFYERKEIKDMVAYLRLLLNNHDELSLKRIINVPNRKIGPKTVGDLQQWATEKGVTLFQAIQQADQHPTLGKAAKTALTEFGRLMNDLTSAIDELALPELLDRIAEKSGYGPELRGAPESDLDRWANVLELRRVAEDYSEIETSVALELFLENVALVGGADTTQTGENGKLIREENTDAVTLITLHAAKGLEYPVVFIVGMDEGSLPHSRSVDKPEQLEEERRLAYVGFTRAMRRLYLVRAYRRSFFGESHPTEPSRFLDDIPSHLIANPAITTSTGETGSTRSQPSNRATQRRNTNWDEDDYNQDPDYSRDTGRTFGSGKSSTYGGNSSAKPDRIIPPSWAPRTGSYSSPTVPPSSSSGKKMPPQPAPQPAKPKEQQYKPGDKVRHDKFGEGVILKSEMEQNTEFVEVQFKGKTGKKRLSMDFARLEKI